MGFAQSFKRNFDECKVVEELEKLTNFKDT
jgi:hypothetical protein